MKLFTTEEISAIERATIEKEGITLHALVERAGQEAARAVARRWAPSQRIIVFAGPGNNGADALATAIFLVGMGYKPTVFLLNIGGNRISDECRRWRDEIRTRFGNDSLIEVVGQHFSAPEIQPGDVVIDGMFGTGLREPLVGGFMALARYINESGAKIVSIDVPSGMCGDWNRQLITRNVIHADITLAIQFPKIAFFFAENAEIVGQWEVLDIGLSRQAIDQRPTNFVYIEEGEVRHLLHRRPRFCSKADFGSACLVAGRYGMVGASVLASRGALGTGVGKLTIHGPQCSFEICQSMVPEAMFHADANKIHVSQITLDHPFNALGIGPGLGTDDATIDALDSFLRSRPSMPLVIDADGLNCIARRPSMLEQLPMLTVITPHAGEFDRLFGESGTEESRLIKAIDAARRYNILVLLKGAYSALVRPDGKVYFNSTGTPALATPGSGDVLTGMVTSFIAQGHKPEIAALLGSFVHGLAGRIASRAHGEAGTSASDIAACAGMAIDSIVNPHSEYKNII